MAIQVQGNSGAIADVDGTSFRALRTAARPLDTGALGHFRYGGFTGILPAALAANSEIFQFRWADPTRLCVVRKIRVSAAVSTTMFAAGVPVQLDLVKATAWSVAGSGGTNANVGANLRKRTSMSISLVVSNDMRIATTAALGAGTKTLEGLSLSALVAAGPITGSLDGTIIDVGTVLWESEVGDGEHPLILTTNEGFVVRSVAVPATGTWMVAFTVDWAEIATY